MSTQIVATHPFVATAITLIATAVILGTVASLVATALCHFCVHYKLRNRRSNAAYAPPISVLKPLKGVDDGLEQNLASLAEQDYSGPFELVLGAVDPQDPALDVAARIRRRFPELTIKLVSGRVRPGLNPKVQNLMALSDAATWDTVLVSDSNIRARPSYLRDIAMEMSDPKVGLVSNMIAGGGERSFGATLENLHLNSFVAGSVCGADVVAHHPVVVGKSMLMRKSDLDRLGGWSRVADVLGEDYLLGQAFSRAGFRVVLSPHVIDTINVSWSMRRFVSRHLRWSQLRRWVAPQAYLFEPLLNPLPWLMAVAGLITFRGIPDRPDTTMFLVILAAAGVLKVTSDAVLSRRLRGRWPTLAGLAAVPAKDLLVLGLWAAGWVHRTIDWRGNRLRIGPGSVLSPMGVDPVAGVPESPASALSRLDG
jgi:ceramide glucosyltransferase